MKESEINARIQTGRRILRSQNYKRFFFFVFFSFLSFSIYIFLFVSNGSCICIRVKSVKVCVCECVSVCACVSNVVRSITMIEHQKLIFIYNTPSENS